MTSSPSSPTPSPTPPQSGDTNSDKKEGILARRTPLSFLFRLLLLLLIIMGICFIVFYIMIGTSRGTKFFVEKIIHETGVDIVYGEGNLRDGLKVQEVALAASDDVSVHIIDAYIKIGWRALFRKEVHLGNTTIGRIEVVNTQPPTGNPFDYKTLELPVNLRFDSVKIDAIEYDQAGREPIVVTDVYATDLNWIDTTVNTRDTTLKYGEIFNIADLEGYIDLTGDYPLKADAVVTVNALEKVYFDPLQLSAAGSLKLTTGSVVSLYNNQEVTGEFAVQGVEPNAPFDAKLVWDEAVLPYAKSQEITLQSGSVVASGDISNIDLQLDTLLTGKNIPMGHYQGSALIANNQMNIKELVAVTKHGNLSADGILDWQSAFKMDTTIKGAGFKIRALLPEDYQAYAPRTLDGTLVFKLDTDPKLSAPNVNTPPHTATSNTVTATSNTTHTPSANSNTANNNIDSQLNISVALNQKDGEHIIADINQGIKPQAPRLSAPWYVDASWSNVKRQNIPTVGDLDSPYGKANVQIRDDRLWVDAKARINELNVAPMGNYDISISKQGNKIGIRGLDYEGVIGDLAGTGEINLATQNQPLTWQIDASTQGLNPSAYNTNLNTHLPVSNLVGHIAGSGRMITTSRRVGGKRLNAQRHEFNITASDLRAVIADNASNTQNVNSTTPSSDINNKSQGNTATNNSNNSRTVHLQGQADGSVNLLQGDIEKFAVKFNGSLDAQNIGASVPKGSLIVDVSGTPQDITLNTLTHTGEAGNIDAKGKLNLANGVAWDVTATADKFDIGFFTPQFDAVVTGDLISAGKWHANNTKIGELEAFDIEFNGSVDTPELPQGTLAIDASIDANDTSQAVKIRKFEHIGEAGNISATGQVKVQDGIQWDITATTHELDVSYFAPQTEAIISGDLISSGKWQASDKAGGATANNGANASALEGLQDFAVDFDGHINTPQLPKGRLNINAKGNAKQISIQEFSHVGDAGRIYAKGDVDLSDGVNWQINAVMNDFNVGYFVEDMPSSITGHIDTSGNWQDEVQRINIADMILQGTLKGEALSAQGSLSATLHLPTDLGQYFDTLQQAGMQEGGAGVESQATQLRALVDTLDANEVALVWGNNQVVINGDAARLQANVNVTSIDKLIDGISGSVVGGITLVQPQNNSLPTIYADLTARRVALPNFAMQSGVIKGKVVDLGKRPSTFALSATNLNVADRNFDTLTALFTGTEAKHVLSAKISSPQATIDAVLKGGLTRDNGALRWAGVMGDGEVTSEYISLNQRQPAQIIVNLGGNGNSFDVQVASHCWIASNDNGKLCLRDNLIATEDRGQVNIAMQQIDTRLISPFLPKDISWQAKVNGKAIVGWQKGADPTINATLYSDNGRIGLTQEGSAPDTTLPYQRISLIAISVPSGLKLRTDIDNGHGGKGFADVVVDPYSVNKDISGEVVLDEINMELFKPFFPGMRTLEGELTMAGQVEGSLSQPIFNGDVELSNARIAMLELPVNLSNINAISHIRGQNASIDGTFNSGDGEGTLTGNINWQQALQAKLSIEGERLIVTQPPALFAEVTPDIDIIIRPNEKFVDIQGTVLVPTATLRPPEANEDVVVESEDVVVLDRRLIGNIDEVLAISKPWSINANIGVDLGDEVYFRGFGAVLPLAGALNITQEGLGQMEALGVIQVARRSEVDVFGQSLELNYGQIRFNGDVLNPNLSIEAVKDIEDQTVGLRVTGEVAEPNITVFNDAGLTEQQAMNALITGRISNSGATQISAEGFKSQVTNNLAAAGLSIGLSGTRSLTNSIGKAFGLQRLTVDASGNDNDTNVNVTGYITPDLYIRYGVGVFNAETTLSMRYQLTRRIYIEATSATENAIDVVYSWEF